MLEIIPHIEHPLTANRSSSKFYAHHQACSLHLYTRPAKAWYCHCPGYHELPFLHFARWGKSSTFTFRGRNWKGEKMVTNTLEQPEAAWRAGYPCRVRGKHWKWPPAITAQLLVRIRFNRKIQPWSHRTWLTRVRERAIRLAGVRGWLVASVPIHAQKQRSWQNNKKEKEKKWKHLSME